VAKILAIGDVHNHWVQAQAIIDKYNDTHKIVLVGDYFDNFHDTAIDADQVARWLKKTLENPNIIALMGNHDINYDYRNVRDSGQIYNCQGKEGS
jgi:predicted MPP superfamily phosphohydrolase